MESVKNKRRRHICRVLRIVALLVLAGCIVLGCMGIFSALQILLMLNGMLVVEIFGTVMIGFGAAWLAERLRGL